MKKYLFVLSALALAVGFSSFTAIKATAKKKFTTFYFLYNTSAPFTPAGYSTAANYVSTIVGNYDNCDNGGTYECGLATTQEQNVGGVEQPIFNGTSITFNTTTGFPQAGTQFVSNATSDVE
jgi:hypothetical protein